MSGNRAAVTTARSWAEAGSLAQPLAEAFLDDPVWANIGPRRRPHRSLANRVAFWGIVRGSRRHGARMRGARLEPAGRPVGATIAFGPGDWPPPGLAFGWELPWAFTAGPLPVWRGVGADNAMRRTHVEYPHMYLWYIGVEPGVQGEGVGRALMDELHAEADERGLPTYLETGTASNVGFYESLGYEVLGRLPIPSGIDLWRMERPAASGSA